MERYKTITATAKVDLGRGVRVKLVASTTSPPEVDLAAAAVKDEHGITEHSAKAGELVTVNLYKWRTYEVQVGETSISYLAPLYPIANGRVGKAVVAGQQIGICLKATSAVGEITEMLLI